METQNGEISLKELIDKAKEWYSYLLSQWKVIVLAGIVGATLGLTYSVGTKPTYTATLSFVVEDEKSGGGLSSALGLASSLGLDMGGGSSSVFSGTNLIEFFKSRKMVEQTLLTPVIVGGKTISLAEMYIQNQKLRDSWATEPRFANLQFLPNADRTHFSRVQDSILGGMYSSLSKNNLLVYQKEKKISIFSIDMISENEMFSKFFTEALAKNVSDFYVTTKSKKARMNMAILEKQTDSIRRELNGAITGVAAANDDTFGLNPALNVRRTPSAKKQVDVQANTAILIELVKQTELAKVTLRKETPLIQIIDRPILPLSKERLGKAKGLLLGGILAGLLGAIGLIFRRLLNELKI